jgi:hypothetical protein
MKIIDCDQGSEDWFRARMGIPTASEFATVMRTKGKGENGESKERRTYMMKLAGELLTGEPMESYTSVHMERGRVMEDEARTLYAFMTDTEPQRVGFIVNGQKGCSPDSLIGANAGLEIKTALPHIQIERLLRNEMPPEHKAQVQGNMWVAERERWDFVSYWPKLPLLVVTAYRDDKYIDEMAKAVDQFNSELHELVEKIRRYGEPAEQEAA